MGGRLPGKAGYGQTAPYARLQANLVRTRPRAQGAPARLKRVAARAMARDGSAIEPRASGAAWRISCSSKMWGCATAPARRRRSEEHTSELQSLMRNSYAVFCLKKKTKTHYRQQLYKH